MTAEITPFEFTAKGEVVACNLDSFLPAIRERIAAFNLSPRTDEEFGQATEDARQIQSWRDELRAGKERALADAEKLNAAFQAIDTADKELLAAKSKLEKQIEDRKAEIRKTMLQGALSGLTCDPSTRPGFRSQFEGAIKGKRTIETMRAALKAEVDALNQRFAANLTTLAKFEGEHGRAAIPDYRNLEISDPSVLESELRRRVEAIAAEKERRRLAAQVEAERKAAEAARKSFQDQAQRATAAMMAQHARNAPEAARMAAQANAANPGAPAMIEPAEPEPVAEETEADEWARFDRQFLSALLVVKAIRATLTHPANIDRAAKMAEKIAQARKEANQ